MRVGEQPLLDHRGGDRRCLLAGGGLHGRRAGTRTGCLRWRSSDEAAISWLASADAGAAEPCCEPALAGAVGAFAGLELDWAASCWEICLAVTLTGLGTGYVLGIEPRFAYV